MTTMTPTLTAYEREHLAEMREKYLTMMQHGGAGFALYPPDFEKAGLSLSEPDLFARIRHVLWWLRWDDGSTITVRLLELLAFLNNVDYLRAARADLRGDTVKVRTTQTIDLEKLVNDACIRATFAKFSRVTPPQVTPPQVN